MNKNINLIISKLSRSAQKKLTKSPMPTWIDPMLATLTETYFSSKDYLYEHKWDGIRLITFKHGDTVTLMTRNKNKVTNDYPDVVNVLKKFDFDFIIDGEVIASENGLSDFGLLQLRRREKNLQISYQIFDIMHIDGYDLTKLELLDRKFILQNAFKSKKPVYLTEHILEKGVPYLKEACAKGWEGLIAKEIHSTYEEGIRSKDWLKFKCIEQQEFVIGGFTKPHGHRLDFGALLLGYFENGKLIYIGKVGTGFSEDTLRTLGAKLEKLKISKCPFESIDIPLKDIYWVKPKLVAEIKFSEWTKYNKLRHPRFKGVRTDKDAKDVVKEKPIKLL